MIVIYQITSAAEIPLKWYENLIEKTNINTTVKVGQVVYKSLISL